METMGGVANMIARLIALPVAATHFKSVAAAALST
jgi:hypothetical protein